MWLFRIFDSAEVNFVYFLDPFALLIYIIMAHAYVLLLFFYQSGRRPPSCCCCSRAAAGAAAVTSRRLVGGICRRVSRARGVKSHM